MNGEILETARQRAQEAGHENMQFIAGDARTVDLPGGYDAVVGRLVLMYMGDPGDALRQLKQLLRRTGSRRFKRWIFCHTTLSVIRQPAYEQFDRVGAQRV